MPVVTDLVLFARRKLKSSEVWLREFQYRLRTLRHANW